MVAVLTGDQGTGGGKIERRRWHKGKAKASLCGCVRDTCGTRPHDISIFGCQSRSTRTAQAAEMPPTFLEKGARDQYEALVDKYDTWLFDCDGVLWNGDRLVDGGKEILEMLRRKSACDLIWCGGCGCDVWLTDLALGGVDKSIVFVTNNATKSRKNYKKKFDKLGIDATVV